MIRSRDQGAYRARQRTRHRKHHGKGRQHGGLGQRVEEHVASEQPVYDLDQPPRQWRQLVIAELPFAAVDQGLDQVERQIDEEDRRQCGPDREVQDQKRHEKRAGMLADGIGNLIHRGASGSLGLGL